MLTRAPQRLLGGMWLDAALVITVVGLVYTLGLFPIKSTPTNAANPGAPVSAISPAAAAAPKTPARVIKRSGDISPAPAASSPSANRYDSLRDAWSN